MFYHQTAFLFIGDGDSHCEADKGKTKFHSYVKTDSFRCFLLSTEPIKKQKAKVKFTIITIIVSLSNICGFFDRAVICWVTGLC